MQRVNTEALIKLMHSALNMHSELNMHSMYAVDNHLQYLY